MNIRKNIVLKTLLQRWNHDIKFPTSSQHLYYDTLIHNIVLTLYNVE